MQRTPCSIRRAAGNKATRTVAPVAPHSATRCSAAAVRRGAGSLGVTGAWHRGCAGRGSRLAGLEYKYYGVVRALAVLCKSAGANAANAPIALCDSAAAGRARRSMQSPQPEELRTMPPVHDRRRRSTRIGKQRRAALDGVVCVSLPISMFACSLARPPSCITESKPELHSLLRWRSPAHASGHGLTPLSLVSCLCPC